MFLQKLLKCTELEKTGLTLNLNSNVVQIHGLAEKFIGIDLDKLYRPMGCVGLQIINSNTKIKMEVCVSTYYTLEDYGMLKIIVFSLILLYQILLLFIVYHTNHKLVDYFTKVMYL